MDSTVQEKTVEKKEYIGLFTKQLGQNCVQMELGWTVLLKKYYDWMDGLLKKELNCRI